MDQDKVSVLLAVPSDQVEDLPTRETIQSIASQSYPASLIETLQVQFVPQTPGGRTAALNAARDQAKGEFLIYTEPGVTWDPSKVERQVLRLREGGEEAGAGSAHRISVRDASEANRFRTDIDSGSSRRDTSVRPLEAGGSVDSVGCDAQAGRLQAHRAADLGARYPAGRTRGNHRADRG